MLCVYYLLKWKIPVYFCQIYRHALHLRYIRAQLQCIRVFIKEYLKGVEWCRDTRKLCIWHTSHQMYDLYKKKNCQNKKIYIYIYIYTYILVSHQMYVYRKYFLKYVVFWSIWQIAPADAQARKKNLVCVCQMDRHTLHLKSTRAQLQCIRVFLKKYLQGVEWDRDTFTLCIQYISHQMYFFSPSRFVTDVVFWSIWQIAPADAQEGKTKFCCVLVYTSLFPLEVDRKKPPPGGFPI